MGKTEMRGCFFVTIFPDHEEWQLTYTDGTLGDVNVVTAETCMPECNRCHRWWNERYLYNVGPIDNVQSVCFDCISVK